MGYTVYYHAGFAGRSLGALLLLEEAGKEYELIEGADYVEEADLVIMALGFEPEDLPTLWNTPELPVNRWGTVKADYITGATELDGVYAVGDIVRGASLVVWAIKDGRDCAQAILEKMGASVAIAAE